MTTTTKKRKYEGPTSEEVLCADLVALMERGELPPWRREWSGQQGQHRNLLSGHEYAGANPVLLELGGLLRGQVLPLWIGAAEAKGKGWWPRKGSKACRIVRPQLNKREQADDNGQPLKGADGEPLISAWVSFKPACVFNAGDLQGRDETAEAGLQEAIAKALGQVAWTTGPAQRVEGAEAVLEAWPVRTVWGGARACYSPMADQIHMPPAEAFGSREAMLATWAHEMAHSTGHRERLNRPMGGGRDGQEYAREELIAELASVLICYRLRIGYEIENHAAYLRVWAEQLREGGPRALFQVLSAARKAADLIVPDNTSEGEG